MFVTLLYIVSYFARMSAVRQLICFVSRLKLQLITFANSIRMSAVRQFRLLLSQAAYILMLQIRQAAEGTEFATAQLEWLRSMLLKGAAKVSVSARRVMVELSRHCPFAAIVRQILHRLQPL